MNQHPALTMLGVWVLCAAAFLILPFQLLDRQLAWQGIAVLVAFMGAFLLGAAMVPTTRQRPSVTPMSTVNPCKAERFLMLVATAAILFLLMDLQDKNPFDLAAASESRSESADALLKGETSSSSIWFQIAFLLYPASYVFMATHLLYAKRILLWKLGVFGFLPVVLATASMGGRMPIFYAALVAGLAWRERSKVGADGPSRADGISAGKVSPRQRPAPSPSAETTPCPTAGEGDAHTTDQWWIRRILVAFDRSRRVRHAAARVPLGCLPAGQPAPGSRRYQFSSSSCAPPPDKTRWLIKLLWLVLLGALFLYFVAVFSTRAAVVGGSAEMFAVAEDLWGIGFRGLFSDTIFSMLGDDLAYLTFIFSWYVVQGVVMCNYLFSWYDGPLQLGIYGVDLISAVMRRFDPQRVSDGFDSLLTLGTYGFFPSAWGSLYVDFGYFALVLCIAWGAFAALCYKRIVLQRRQDWLLVGPFVTIGVVCSTINTPLGFTNGFVTHVWLLVVFVIIHDKPRN